MINKEYIIIEGNLVKVMLRDKTSNNNVDINYYLQFDKIDDKFVEVSLWSNCQLTPNQIVKIGNLPSILSKRYQIMKVLEETFSEIPVSITQRIREGIIEVQNLCRNNSDSVTSAENASASKPIVITPERRKRALNLLTNPDMLNVIDLELESKIKGEQKTRLYIFVCFAQSFTKDYLQISTEGESAVGKSYTSINTLRVFPRECYEIVGRVSKRALERIDLNDEVRIIYIQEQRGGEAASDSIRLSSSSDGGMEAWIVNPTTHELERLKMKGRTIASTTTSLVMYDEDATRSVRIKIDSSYEQTKKVIQFQAEQAEYPTELMEALGLVSVENEESIQDAIRLLDKKLDVIIPYQRLIAEGLDLSLIRIRRDHKKILGHIKTLAWLRQYQREILAVNDKRWIVATLQDYLDALSLCEKSITETYFEVTDSFRDILSIINNCKPTDIYKVGQWAPRERLLGVHTEQIVEGVKNQLGKKSTWTGDNLAAMVRSGLLAVSYERNSGIQPGNYYRVISVEERESIFKMKPDREQIEKRIQEWKIDILNKMGENEMRFVSPPMSLKIIDSAKTEAESPEPAESNSEVSLSNVK